MLAVFLDQCIPYILKHSLPLKLIDFGGLSGQRARNLPARLPAPATCVNGTTPGTTPSFYRHSGYRNSGFMLCSGNFTHLSLEPTFSFLIETQSHSPRDCNQCRKKLDCICSTYSSISLIRSQSQITGTRFKQTFRKLIIQLSLCVLSLAGYKAKEEILA